VAKRPDGGRLPANKQNAKPRCSRSEMGLVAD
jgi:hypothetical protein